MFFLMLVLGSSGFYFFVFFIYFNMEGLCFFRVCLSGVCRILFEILRIVLRKSFLMFMKVFWIVRRFFLRR